MHQYSTANAAVVLPRRRNTDASTDEDCEVQEDVPHVSKSGQGPNAALTPLVVDEEDEETCPKKASIVPSGDDDDSDHDDDPVQASKGVLLTVTTTTLQPMVIEEERETWSKKVDFLLSVIGFAVDLANVWRFPYLCYKNGGGAFLIPYGIMLIVGGIPLFYMELALGQYNRKGAITCWGRLVPLFKGIGYAVALIAFYVDFYYNVIIAWALRFFFASFAGFRTQLPWTNCGNPWNTKFCREIDDRQECNETSNATTDGFTSLDFPNDFTTTSSPTPPSTNCSNFTSPAEEYFVRNILELNKSSGIHDLGYIKTDMAACLLAVYIICYFSLWKGISTSGKVVWFTALFPYAVLLILLIHGIQLEGALDGIKYYLKPNFDAIFNAQNVVGMTDDPWLVMKTEKVESCIRKLPQHFFPSTEVWVDAATQVFFSLGPGFGVLLAFASYNKFHNNVYMDAILTSCINSATSFVAGFVIFAVLGYMAQKTGKHISHVAQEGPGLVFEVYPAAIASMPGSTFWALIFFMMLLTLGLDSSFGGSEAIITALSDEFPVIGSHREIFVLCLFTLYFIVGLASCTQGGFYFFNLLERYAAGYSILFAVFFEAIAVSWIYGIDRFSSDIREMMGFYPGIYWRVCWKFVAPIFILFIIFYGLLSYEPLVYEGYAYPHWANVLGWLIASSSVAMIPGMAIYKIIITPGTLRQRLKILTTPWRDTQMQATTLNGIQCEGNQVKSNIVGEAV